jgi:iron complex outermembrane receptor protein
LGAAKEWAWALDYSHDENREASHFSSATTYLNQAVAQGFYNPVRDLSRFPNSTPLSQLLDTTDTHRKPEIDAVNLRLSGRLFTLPAGDVQISIGGEWRQERYYSDALTVFPPVVSPFIASIFGSTINGTVNASREARAAYAELNVPLLNEGNRVFLVHELSLSAAVRYESFGNFSYSSTFGDGTVSTVAPDNIHAAPLAVALKYAPNRHFALRASWSQSFISPTMTDLFSARTTLANGLPLDYFDPLLNTTVTAASGTVLATQGGNPSLKPETGYSLNYGVIFTPDWAWAKGLSLTLDYFRVTNDNLVANPELTTVLKDLPGRVTRDAGGNLIAYDVSALNVSRLVAGGFDAKLNWEFPAVRHGRFVWSAQATYYDTYERRLFPGDPSEQRISDRTFALALAANTPLRLKGQSALFWTAPENMLGLPGSFTTGLTARYVSHYKDHYNTGAYSTLPTLSAIDGDWVASSTEFDLQLSYSPAGEILREGGKTKAQNRSRTWFADTKFTLGVQNLADRRPSYTSSNPSFYSFFNDPRQRYTYLEIKKTY